MINVFATFGLGLLFIVFSGYLFVIGALEFASEISDDSETKARIMDVAFELGGWMPDVAAQSARANRDLAISGVHIGGLDVLSQSYFTIAEQRFLISSEMRPYWPYYLLGVLDTQIRSGSKKIPITFSKLMEVGKFERGIDRGLIKLGLMSWGVLTKEQRFWLVNRIKSSRDFPAFLRFSESIGMKSTICLNLEWKVAKDKCYDKRSDSTEDSIDNIIFDE
ncbi:MAG: hypothetical protein ACPGYX_02510 [Oceanobacter sp.]